MQNQSPTLISVLASKAASYIHKNKLSYVCRKASELLLGFFLGASVVAPAQIVSALEFALKTKDYAVPKVTLFMVVFFGRKKIIRFIKRYRRQIELNHAQKNDEKMIDNIPVPELVDYMLRNQRFKREGVNGVRATFGLNMDKFNRLAKKLEENKVLVRGENNGRILDGKWSRQALIDYLSGEKSSSDLLPRFVVKRIGSNQKLRLMRSEMAM